MRCSTVRESLSARIDGEAIAVSEPALDRHLDACPACQGWLRQAEQLSREVRVGPAPDLGPLLARVLDDVDQVERRRQPRERNMLRVGLCLIALAQLALTIPVLVLGHDREAPLHVTHEMGSWDAALAIGLILAARRPSRAEGMSAIVGVGALLLLVTASVDLIAGRTTVTDEAPHLLCAAGWLLLHRLSVLQSTGSPEPLDAREIAPIGVVHFREATESAVTGDARGGHAAGLSA